MSEESPKPSRVPVFQRVLEALAQGPMEWYALGAYVWPHRTPGCRMWNYSSNGGPPAWVRVMGKAIKRLKLYSYDDPRTGRRMVGRTRETPKAWPVGSPPAK